MLKVAIFIQPHVLHQFGPSRRLSALQTTVLRRTPRRRRCVIGQNLLEDLMNDTTPPDNRQPDAAVTEQTREALEKAEKGDVGGLAPTPKGDAAGIEAAQQEASDGPPGRGLAR
jgi:hypothetical protein